MLFLPGIGNLMLISPGGNRRSDINPFVEILMQRYGMVIHVKPDKLEEYKRLHAAVWPEVLQMIRECHIRNYSIYYKDSFLFSYFEYFGKDFKEDMARMAADPKTQAWWKVTGPCQEPLPTRGKDEWWANMEEVFHAD
jgi:L-rhamnose mutarotase